MRLEESSKRSGEAGSTLIEVLIATLPNAQHHRLDKHLRAMTVWKTDEGVKAILGLLGDTNSFTRGSAISSGYQTTTASLANSNDSAKDLSRSWSTSHIQQIPDSAGNGERRPVGPLMDGNGYRRRKLATTVSGPVFDRR